MSTKSNIVRSLPQRLSEFYDHSQGLASVEHSEEIRLLEARYKSLIGLIEENDNPQRWKDLYNAWSSYENATNKAAITQRKSDMIRVQEALNKVDSLIKSGYLYEYVAWTQILDIMEQLRKTRESEQKRIAQASSIITEKQVQQLIGYVISTIVNSVTNEEERNLVLQKLKNINMY